MSQTLFLTISTLGLLAALGTVLNRNLVHAALHLVGFFFIVACQFVLLEAEFLAAIQVLVYIGAVAIILMFAIMLTRNVQGDETTSPVRFWTLPAIVAGLAVFVVLCVGIHARVGPEHEQRSPWKATQSRPVIVDEKGQPQTHARALAINNMGKAVGNEMLTRFAIPFEVAGLLLTAALVGAIAVAHREGDYERQLIRTGGTTSSTPPTPSGIGTGSANGQGMRAEVLPPPAH